MLDIISLHISAANAGIIAAVYAVLLSFVLSNLIAYTYENTFQGLSYSRSFVQALILGSIVVSIAMQAIGDNIARGIGMFGALTLIRFRSSLKDPKDMIFIFGSLAVGIATGVHSYLTATIGAIGFCMAAFAIYKSPLGQNTYFDGLVRFNLKNTPESSKELETKLNEHCSKFALVTLREIGQGDRTEYAYQFKLKTNSKADNLSNSLGTLNDIKGVSLMLQEATVEL
jgi:uncharacterized membrane protein YhiD involved in acid resistance